MVVCAVFGCNNNNSRKSATEQDEKSKVSFVTFPKDKDSCALWIRACKREPNFNFKLARVCTEHFLPEDFIVSLKHRLLNYVPKGARRIRPGCVPSLKLPSIAPVTSESRDAQQPTDNLLESMSQGVDPSRADMDGGVDIDVKQEWCGSDEELDLPPIVKTEVSVDHENYGFQGVDQVSQSGYSASINLAQKTWPPKREQQATETKADFGFVEVDVDRVQPPEQHQSPSVDPLQLSAPQVGVDDCQREIQFVDVKREPWEPEETADTGGPESEQEQLPSTEDDETPFDQNVPVRVCYADAVDEASNDSEEDNSALSGIGRSDCDSAEGTAIEPSPQHNRSCSNEKPYACVVCGSSFARTGNLTKHFKSHMGIRPHACAQCDAQFIHKSHLREHAITHSGERRHVCDVCGSRFGRKEHLSRHVRSHTGDRSHACDVCDARFSDRFNLTRHARRHTGVRPYSCDACPAVFYLKAHLSRHAVTHTGGRSYACRVCHRTFADKSNVTRHMKRHTGAGAPFSCGVCPAVFYSKAHLTMHSKTHCVEKV